MTRELRTEAELRELVSEPARAAAEKAIDHVDAESARFIAASPFFLLASTAADGSCDVSPRGDPPGSVLLLDERTLVFGDRKGNRRMDSMTNILQRPRVGLPVLVPGWGTRCGSTDRPGSSPFEQVRAVEQRCRATEAQLDAVESGAAEELAADLEWLAEQQRSASAECFRQTEACCGPVGLLSAAVHSVSARLARRGRFGPDWMIGAT